MKSRLNSVDAAEVTKKTSSTRDAVETAIDIAKENRLNTWANGSSKAARQVTRWHPKHGAIST